MASVSDRENFHHTGPLHLNKLDWKNVDHRRSIAASLVQGAYILERDRQDKRNGPQALAPPWWTFFNFKLCSQLIDDADSSIFAAVYQLNPSASKNDKNSKESPRFVFAFRGTLTKGDAFSRDVELDIHFIKNGLHKTSRFEIAMKAVRNMVTAVGNNVTVWLAGHSLGSAMAMLVGRNMAKNGTFLESFLFNPPFISAPIERIKDPAIKNGIRIASSVITAGIAASVKGKNEKNKSDAFAALSGWVPFLFVNSEDHLCSEYIGYFRHRNDMDKIGAGNIERLAAQHSISGLFMTAIGKESEDPLHLIPSANLTINLSRYENFNEAHGVHQWWKFDLQLKSEVYKY